MSNHWMRHLEKFPFLHLYVELYNLIRRKVLIWVISWDGATLVLCDDSYYILKSKLQIKKEWNFARNFARDTTSEVVW